MEDQVQGLRKLLAKEKTLENSKFITVASGKGGVGKSNFSANLAYTLANSFEKKILLIDADIGMGNIHILLNADPTKNMKQVFNGEEIEKVIVRAKGFYALLGFSGLDSLAELEDFEFNRVVDGLNRISGSFDYVIIDTGAGIDKKVTSFLRASNTTYVITTPEPTAMMDAYALIKSLYGIYGYDHFKVIINMCKSKSEGLRTFEKLRLSSKKFMDLDLELAGLLPFTSNVRKCVEAKALITEAFPSDTFSSELKKIAISEIGEQPVSGDADFWSKVVNYLRPKT